MDSLMDSSSIGLIVALLLLLMASAFFSASETAFSSLSRVRLEEHAEAVGERRISATLALANNFDRLLSTILVGNNIVNITAATLGTLLFTRLFRAYGPTISTVVLTLAVLLFGEVGPKTYAKGHAETVALWAAPALRWIMVLLTPLTTLLGLLQRAIGRLFHAEERPSVTEDEILTMVSTAEVQGEFDRQESNLIRHAIAFGDLEVEDILTPRVDIVSISDQATNEELEDLITSNQFSRIPVWHESIDNLTKVIHVRDFYQAKREGVPWLSKATDILATVTSTPVDDLLREMQTKKIHMSVVLDEFGGTEGLVTLEDILEELVGEIWDEHDEIVEEFKKQPDGSYLISCSASLDDLFDRFSIRATDIDSASISGWVLDQLERLPVEGDRFVFENLDVTVTKVDHRRILEIRVAVIPEEEGK